jgi:hypothetical protein
MKEMHLHGNDYIRVCIKWKPVQIFLTGQVYSWEIGENIMCSVENLKKKCCYFNGEEVKEEKPDPLDFLLLAIPLFKLFL